MEARLPSLCGGLIYGRWLPDSAVISIHPPRVGWDGRHSARLGVDMISIHPPRVGWDLRGLQAGPDRPDFNPPTPCGVGPARAGLRPSLRQFQSTHPVWGGTPDSRWRSWRQKQFQSTHPVWGGTDLERMTSSDGRISIHPPRVGWDGAAPIFAPRKERFQSTHPVWGGTGLRLFLRPERRDFNPPTPCGVGLTTRKANANIHNFNPPTPCGVGR